MDSADEIRLLRARVGELEQRVEHLRVSRRVLMNLLEKVEREKVALVHQLEKENVRLQRDNKRFAKWIFSKNKEIVELKEQVESTRQKA
ncbi:translation initiation factor 2 [Desulfosporosinus sp. PR]|uniref:translation initiation factor 2 n=1 Tax=Candidatus Desulfosporosinus nitrosoreducens TaxID=3401928 RepID=UPI0027F1FD44|nr:translation initiation factor 2 [Desulfosporosinus sp. PR]MDQ7096074.1 translation initiation factor 2 [Desulfosporosinus sp. PR]